jgi:aldose 1-epimerase
MQELITIKNDLLEVSISPLAGGSIYSFKYCLDGSWTDMMRATSPNAVKARNAGEFSSFCLIPYSSILENGVLNFKGSSYKLYTHNESEHRGHGELRYKPCKVTEISEQRVVLTFDSRDFNSILWPFPFITTVEYLVDGNSFKMNITLKNTGNSDMPGGLGIHPYFVRNLAGTKQDIITRIPMKGVYPGEDQIHSGTWEDQPECHEFTEGKILSGAHLDKCYRIYEDPSIIEWTKTGLKLSINSSSLFGHVVIYCPPDDESSFAVEPVSHCNNAFNMHEAGIKDTGTVIIKAGEEIEGTIEIAIDRK